MTFNYDAVIIGAGIIGNCIAFELAKRGKKTLSLDMEGGSGLGTTAASCAIIRLHYSSAQGVALAREGYFYWLNWDRYLGVEDPLGNVHYKNTGALVFKTPLNWELSKVMAALDELGVTYLELTPEQIADYLPSPCTDSFHPMKKVDHPAFGQAGGKILGAIYVPESGYVSDPKLSTHNVEVAASRRGAEFLFKAKVVDVLKEDGQTAGVRLADGREIAAPVVINAAGPHSYLINRMAGVEGGMSIKTKALRVEVAHVPSPKGVDWQRYGLMVSDSDCGIYSRPEVGNHWLIGSEEPECDELHYVDPDDWDNRSLGEQWKAQVMRQALRVPELPIPNQPRGLASLYDLSDDWYPIYDKSDLPGYYMAIGTSGNQYKNAPVVGDLMAGLVDYCQAGNDHDAKPFQYRMPFLKRHLDIGFFSRRRKINPNSTFSVIG